MSKVFRLIDMENYNNEPVLAVGVHVLRWQPEWGEPKYGFTDDEEVEKILQVARDVVNSTSLGDVSPKLEALKNLLEQYDNFVEENDNESTP